MTALCDSSYAYRQESYEGGEGDDRHGVRGRGRTWGRGGVVTGLDAVCFVVLLIALFVGPKE